MEKSLWKYWANDVIVALFPCEFDCISYSPGKHDFSAFFILKAHSYPFSWHTFQMIGYHLWFCHIWQRGQNCICIRSYRDVWHPAGVFGCRVFFSCNLHHIVWWNQQDANRNWKNLCIVKEWHIYCSVSFLEPIFCCIAINPKSDIWIITKNVSWWRKYFFLFVSS